MASNKVHGLITGAYENEVSDVALLEVGEPKELAVIPEGTKAPPPPNPPPEKPPAPAALGNAPEVVTGAPLKTKEDVELEVVEVEFAAVLDPVIK